MKSLSIKLIFILFFCSSAVAQGGKLISDCTVFFNVSAGSEANLQVAKSMEGTTKVIYIKGSKSRSDLITNSFKQTTLTDAKTDSTIILREIGNAKYISYLSGNKMKEQNKKYEGIVFDILNEKKTILGYECQKAVAKLADGSIYDVYYTTSITPSNKQYQYQFKNLSGFVLEYEEISEDSKTKITYTASKISLVSVPAAIFDPPKSGYRIL